MSIYPGTPITWLPVELVDVWRGIAWLSAVVILFRMVINANAYRREAPVLIVGRLGLVAFMIGDFIQNVERVGQPATWEGMPFTTLGLVFTGWATFLDTKAKGDDDVRG